MFIFYFTKEKKMICLLLLLLIKETPRLTESKDVLLVVSR